MTTRRHTCPRGSDRAQPAAARRPARRCSQRDAAPSHPAGIHTRTYTRTYTRAHTCTRTHTYTYTHTHTLSTQRWGQRALGHDSCRHQRNGGPSRAPCPQCGDGGGGDNDGALKAVKQPEISAGRTRRFSALTSTPFCSSHLQTSTVPARIDTPSQAQRRASKPRARVTQLFVVRAPQTQRRAARCGSVRRGNAKCKLRDCLTWRRRTGGRSGVQRRVSRRRLAHAAPRLHRD
jgi:hypothetical protein